MVVDQPLQYGFVNKFEKSTIVFSIDLKNQREHLLDFILPFHSNLRIYKWKIDNCFFFSNRFEKGLLNQSSRVSNSISNL